MNRILLTIIVVPMYWFTTPCKSSSVSCRHDLSSLSLFPRPQILRVNTWLYRSGLLSFFRGLTRCVDVCISASLVFYFFHPFQTTIIVLSNQRRNLLSRPLRLLDSPNLTNKPKDPRYPWKLMTEKLNSPSNVFYISFNPDLLLYFYVHFIFFRPSL